MFDLLMQHKDLIGGFVSSLLVNEAVRMSKLQSNSILHLGFNIIKTGYSLVTEIASSPKYKELKDEIEELKKQKEGN